jgi:hypothetical protein
MPKTRTRNRAKSRLTKREHARKAANKVKAAIYHLKRT